MKTIKNRYSQEPGMKADMVSLRTSSLYTVVRLMNIRLI